jgi:hypothetical protein
MPWAYASVDADSIEHSEISARLFMNSTPFMSVPAQGSAGVESMGRHPNQNHILSRDGPGDLRLRPRVAPANLLDDLPAVLPDRHIAVEHG